MPNLWEKLTGIFSGTQDVKNDRMWYNTLRWKEFFENKGNPYIIASNPAYNNGIQISREISESMYHKIESLDKRE